MSDDAELARIRRLPPTDGLFADPLPDAVERHVAAIASVESNATPEETRIVDAVQATLRTMTTWSADDVRDLLSEAGVPDTLAVRRRYASRCVNGLRDKVARGKRMTRHNARSGREVTVWGWDADATIDKARTP